MFKKKVSHRFRKRLTTYQRANWKICHAYEKKKKKEIPFFASEKRVHKPVKEIASCSRTEIEHKGTRVKAYRVPRAQAKRRGQRGGESRKRVGRGGKGVRTCFGPDERK